MHPVNSSSSGRSLETRSSSTTTANIKHNNNIDRLQSAQQEEESCCCSFAQCWEFVTSTVYAIFEAIAGFFNVCNGQNDINKIKNIMKKDTHVSTLEEMVICAEYAASLSEDNKDKADILEAVSQMLEHYGAVIVKTENGSSSILHLIGCELVSLLGNRHTAKKYESYAVSYPSDPSVSKAIRQVIINYGEKLND